MRLGCIADDYTGASDVATALNRSGLRTALLFGPPKAGTGTGDADAVVIGLKIRTAPAERAVEAALGARAWLALRAAERVYFKYCSTFDSTKAGNIGPIADALLTAAGAPLTVVCPVAPEHGRTVYQGHLFVGSQLLAETSMRDHPLTPMRDSSVVRLMDRQTVGAVGLVSHDRVTAGPQAVADELARLRADGVRYAVADAITEGDLRNLGEGARELEVVTGAAGLARHVVGTGIRASRRRAQVAARPGSGARRQLLGGDAETGRARPAADAGVPAGSARRAGRRRPDRRVSGLARRPGERGAAARCSRARPQTGARRGQPRSWRRQWRGSPGTSWRPASAA